MTVALLEQAPSATRPATPADVLAPRTATLVLDAVPASVAPARHWLCAQVAAVAVAAGASTDAVDVAELLGSEVLTNAVRHGAPNGAVSLSVTASDGALRVTVTDGGATLPVVREPAADAVGGRGLQLVEALAAAWGVQPHLPTGKSVWFELALTPAAAHHAA